MHVAGSALLGRKKLPILDKLSRISFEGSLLSRAYLQNQSLKHFVCSHWTRTAWREKKRKLVLLEDDASAGQFSSFFKIDDTTQDIAYMCDPAVLIDQALFENDLSTAPAVSVSKYRDSTCDLLVVFVSSTM